VRGALDRDVLTAGAEALRGRHDFRALANAGSPRASTVRTVHGLGWTFGSDGVHRFDIVGDGFLYRMVRSIVGTLVDWARHPEHLAATEPDDGAAGAARTAMNRLLEGGERSDAGPVAPARGLCLMATGLADGHTVGALPPFPVPPLESTRPPSSGGLT
jgi:tRNA pseudouridine38-40 synthase